MYCQNNLFDVYLQIKLKTKIYMKSILIIILLTITSLVSFSCKNTNNPKEEAKSESLFEKYEKARKKASFSPQIVDTVFMGLTFNMSEKQAISHLRKLLKKGKLEDNFGELTYTLTFAGESSRATISLSYFQDKLYEVRLNFYEMSIGKTSTFLPMDGKHLIQPARAAFTHKMNTTKNNYSLYQYNLSEIGWIHCFIKDNLIVEFSPLGIMSYTNAPVEREKKIFEMKQKSEKAQQTMSDL
jgi:hypothetical protein